MMAVLLVFAGCTLVAWCISSVVVAIADLLGLCWRAEDEAKRHPPESLNAAAHRTARSWR